MLPWLSPDETAVAVTAKLFALQGNLQIINPLLSDFSWLHPRSFVSQGDSMVPVGFLGLPVLLGMFSKIFGDFIFLIWGPLLALSVLYPLYQLTTAWQRTARIITMLVWLSFPTVLLYAYRGLFPNLSVICFMVWSIYLIQKHRTVARSIAAGLLFGAAIAIRPIEMIWMLPWLIFLSDWKKREWIPWFIGGAVFFCLITLLAAYRTYGSPFVIGYWLHDTPTITARSSPQTTASWPFGFHPKNVAMNMLGYFGWYLWPWMLGVAAAAWLFWKKQGLRKEILLAAWTFIALTLVYGQALYQDHIGVNVISIGNSFLRYLLPIVPIVALAFGYLVEHLQPKKFFVSMFAVFFIAFGFWTAMIRDDEGIVHGIRERAAYAAIRSEAQANLPRGAVILSDRSDKIFFPTFVVASPMPPLSEVSQLMQTVPVAVYARNLDAERTRAFTDAGIFPEEVVHGERESLYLLSYAP